MQEVQKIKMKRQTEPLAMAALTTSLLILAPFTLAEARVTQPPLQPRDFVNLTASQLNPSTLIYTQSIMPLDDWRKRYPEEAQNLVLYPGYQEPVRELKDVNGQKKVGREELVMYVARLKTVLKADAEAVRSRLPLIIQPQTIKGLDPTVNVKPIGEADLVQNEVAAKREIHNFAWCNTDKVTFLRQTHLKDLSHLTAQRFCQGDRSICLESCYVFTDGEIGADGIKTPQWRTAMSMGLSLKNLSKNAENSVKQVANAGLTAVGMTPLAIDKPEDYDMGITMNSEMRYFLSEAEYAAPAPLSRITRIEAPVIGVVEHRIFFINQLFEFGKIVSVLQQNPDPSQPGTVIMSNFLVMAIHKRKWVDDPFLSKAIPPVVKGEIPRDFKINGIAVGDFAANATHGLEAGIPIYSQDLTKRLADVLEKGATQ